MIPGDDRRSGRHGFYHDKAERFRPIDWKQQGQCTTKKIVFLLVADLTDEFDQRMIKQRLDLAREIFLVGGINLGRYLKGGAACFCDGDGTVHSLFRRYPAEEG